MGSIDWTPQQKLAINTVNGDVLLTASAGAGKTAVLAGRCIYLLTEAPHPCNVDELLVLTFTEAAAAEMRSRIAHRLRQFARNDPRLHRQLILLDKANISTVHSFCHSVLREFFYRLPLDGTFEILDADESELLKLQIATELFEDRYAQSDRTQNSEPELFDRFVQSYGADTGDRPLINLLIRLHNFLDTMQDHESWLAGWSRMLRIEQTDVENLAVVKRQKQILALQIDRVISRLEYARTMIDYYPQLQFYTIHLQDKLLPMLGQVKDALVSGDFPGALEQIGGLSFPRVPNRPKELGEDDIAPVKDLIDRAKAEYQKIQQTFAVASADVIKQLSVTEPFAELLARLHNEFAARYQRSKQRQNVLDFADLERQCLSLLYGQNGPTDLARQLQERFKYVLIDEYQDISPVQEAIIRCLSRGGFVCDFDRHDKSEPLGNLFMVGDLKQSIYGFRQAEPDIFLEKYRKFTPADAADADSARQKKIDLNKNFRSRREIIAGINYIFSRCMTGDFAGIDYHRDAQLVYGATRYDTIANDNDQAGRIELHLIERDLSNVSNVSTEDPDSRTTDGPNELDTTRREAMVVGRRIRQMVADRSDGKAEFNVIDSRTGLARSVEYRDIVILLRSMKMRAELWSEVFGQMGIPVHAELTSGYFVATEIQDMVCLLKLLDNPQQDIPLASVLRSSIAGLNESQLADIRLHTPKGGFYQALCDYGQNGPDVELKEKIGEFLARLEIWRSLARQGNLARLIWRIYRDTDLLAYVSGLPDGRQRYSNLLHLHDVARRFDSFTQQGLARFLRFVEKLREEQGDFGPAPILTEADNVVRIMSVHKSKGLEFPVVIAAELARKFNMQDAHQSILFNSSQSPSTGESCPVGLRIVDTISQDNWSTLARSVIAEDIEHRALAEEMRILYVAFTRACERLILTAGINIDRARSQWKNWRFDCQLALPEFLLSGAAAPIDWLGPALAGHPDMRDFLDDCHSKPDPDARSSPGQFDSRFDVTSYSAEQVTELLKDTAGQPARPKRADSLDELAGLAPGLPTPQVREIIDRINWRYPHKPLQRLWARRSVSDIKHQIDLRQDPDFAPDPAVGPAEKETPASCGSGQTERPPFVSFAKTPAEPFNRRPQFMADQPPMPTAAEKGSWTHLFLQRLDLAGSLDRDDLARQLLRIIDRGFFNDRQALHIDLSSIAKLFTSSLGQKIITHGHHLQREWPFTIAVPAGEVYREEELSDQDRNENVLVRGVIDCLIETDTGLTIIDYKTDQITESQCADRAAFYDVQMGLYRRAVETILKKNVTEMYLYFLTPGISFPVVTGGL